MSYLPDDADVRRRRAAASGATGSPPQPPQTATVSAPRSSTRSRPGLGRFFGMTGLGTVLPGSGLLLSGRRRLGGTLLALFVLAIAAAAAFVYWKGPTAAALFVAVRPRWLLGLSVALGLGVLVWCFSVILTGWVNRPGGQRMGRRLLAAGWVGLLCALLILPTARAAQYAFIQQDLLHSLFDPAGRRSATNRPPDLAAADPWADIPRVTVLLIGSDAYPDREGIRTDSMMAVSVDTQTGDAVLFGIPRNLQGYTFRATNPLHKLYPQGPRCGLECMLNAVWKMASDRASEYPGDPNPGLTTLTEVVSDLLGQQIDNTVVIDIRGFSALVDAMGGVDITVRNRLPIGGKIVNGYIVPGSITGWIEPGRQHMNGYTAMWFARSRVLTDDFDRMRRQRCMVGALVRQVNPVTMINRYPALAKVAKDNIQADVTMAQLPAWSELVTRMQKGSIRSLPFTGSLINLNRPDYPKIHQMVEEALTPPEPAGPSASATATSTPSSTRSRPRSSPSPSASASPSEGLVNVSDAC